MLVSRYIILTTIVSALLVVFGAPNHQPSKSVAPQAFKPQEANTLMSKNELFKKLVGKWTGTCRTWFQPGQLADESEISGEITKMLDGRFLRHRYESSLQDKSREGEEVIAFNSITETYQTTWVDSFHMNYAIMFSQGEATERGFSVVGEYDVAENQPRWGWRTVYELVDDDHLTITSFNIDPQGNEAKAVETKYQRAGG